MLKVAVVIACLAVTGPAMAISCGRQQSTAQAYSSAQHVVSAHVERSYAAPGFGRDAVQFVELRVLKVWKSHLKPGDRVQATAEDSIRFVGDGFVPLLGSDLLVYASSSQPLMLGSCSRTAPLETTLDLKALKALSKRSHGR
ncbi:hypothetical protein [Xanthomonas sp. WHRI 6106]|uniref:hypothetical protein n=1 Tax=Xanthomonas sp. WHRI 6106 TaxID=3161566 RepID=UPI0032E86F92